MALAYLSRDDRIRSNDFCKFPFLLLHFFTASWVANISCCSGCRESWLCGAGLGISDPRLFSAGKDVALAEIVTHPAATAKLSTSGSFFRSSFVSSVLKILTAVAHATVTLLA